MRYLKEFLFSPEQHYLFRAPVLSSHSSSFVYSMYIQFIYIITAIMAENFMLQF